ncbi:MAG TPA: hypothetical protein VFI46_06505 [Jiangellaceae bacterium]|nr:hypothetical protein [Jiangellaceae bacterium]
MGGSIVVLAWPRQTLGVIYELDERGWLDGPGASRRRGLLAGHGV